MVFLCGEIFQERQGKLRFACEEIQQVRRADAKDRAIIETDIAAGLWCAREAGTEIECRFLKDLSAGFLGGCVSVQQKVKGLRGFSRSNDRIPFSVDLFLSGFSQLHQVIRRGKLQNIYFLQQQRLFNCFQHIKSIHEFPPPGADPKVQPDVAEVNVSA